MWFFHKQTNSSAFTSATMVKTSATLNHMAITSANNIQWLNQNVIIASVTSNNLIMFGQNKSKKCQILAKNPSKIVKYNIPHTPSEVGVMVRKTFSHTPDVAISDGLVKACDQRKSFLLKRKPVISLRIKCVF